MQPLFLLRFGELGLKGDNRPLFLRTLVKRVEEALAGTEAEVEASHGRVYVLPAAGDDAWPDTEEAQAIGRRLRQVFGLVGVHPAWRTSLDLGAIKEAAVKVLGAARGGPRSAGAGGPSTFKVDARRANKGYRYNSLELNDRVGGRLDETFDDLAVDVHEPDITVRVEIRRQAYLYAGGWQAPGGLPVGVSGSAVLLLSGGIDSPVAGWLAMKRGISVLPVYFHSFPFTSDRVHQKVVDLCRVLAGYGGQLTLHTVHFTDIQKALQDKTPPPLLTLLMRRMMMRIAGRLAGRLTAQVLVTGESVGQVASQTLESLTVTGAVTDYPVLRPLVAYDKDNIVALADDIGTYEISTRPYEDCCGLFVPEHPETHPTVAAMEQAEDSLEVEPLIAEALEATDTEVVAGAPVETAPQV